MEKELNFQEQAFKELYLQSFNARGAALGAGYSESVAHTHAHKWVSLTTCPINKRHVYNAIQKAIDEKYGEDVTDSDWVLKRARLLADFNISKFITVDPATKNAIYDFSTATDDDWYCITEYTVDNIVKGQGAGRYEVERVKLKSSCKIQALQLVGKHTRVQAFSENVNLNGEVTQIVMNPEEYKKARADMIAEDDC